MRRTEVTDQGTGSLAVVTAAGVLGAAALLGVTVVQALTVRHEVAASADLAALAAAAVAQPTLSRAVAQKVEDRLWDLTITAVTSRLGPARPVADPLVRRGVAPLRTGVDLRKRRPVDLSKAPQKDDRQRRRAPREDPCTAAARVAAANHTGLVRCAVQGQVVEVTTERTVHVLGRAMPVRADARAGPPGH